jgi:hypothetical protein
MNWSLGRMSLAIAGAKVNDLPQPRLHFEFSRFAFILEGSSE